ncbi:MAG: hypothetical protein QM493_00985 [Sulfurovum sp.]
MFSKLQKMFIGIGLMVIIIGCGGAGSNSGDDSPNNSTSGDNIISQLNSYKSGYFTSFITQNSNNFFEHTDKSLHIAFVDDYELYYAKSTDSGKSWHNEKINTGYDGNIKRASLVVDNNGKVFIGFNAHSKSNYANPTSITYGYEFNYELYCANNLSGIWSIEKVDTFNKSSNVRPNDSAEVADMIIDSNNNIHLFANYSGWWNYGGVAYEYIRTTASNSWSSSNIIAKYSDSVVDKAFYSYFKAQIDKKGDIVILMQRYKSSAGVDDKLVYAYKQSGVWGTPIDIKSPNRTNARSTHFDMAIDGDDNRYIVYLQNNSSGIPEVIIYSIIGAHIAYKGVAGEIINDIKLISDSSGNLTLLVTKKDKPAIVVTKIKTGNWITQSPLSTKDTNGVMYNAVVARTNNLQNSFNNLKIAYKKYVGGVGTGTDLSYDSSTLYFYNYGTTPSPTPATSPASCSMSGTWNIAGGTQTTTYAVNGQKININVPANSLVLTDSDSTVSSNSHIITFDPNRAPYIYKKDTNGMKRSETDTQSGCTQELKEVWTIANSCTSATLSVDILNKCPDSQGNTNSVFNTTATKQ